MTATIRFHATDIQTEGLPFDVELTPEWLEQALADASVEPRRGAREGGRVHGRLSRSGQDIVVRARVKAEVAVPCARCLDPAAISVDAELSLLLQAARPEPRRGEARRPARQDAIVEYEFSAAEAELDVYDGETVVLDDFVRELILLEIPTFPLCRESCPGIAPSHPAIERALEDPDAIDPRLAPLGAFRQVPEGEDRPATLDDLMAAAAQRSEALHGKKPVLRSNRQGPRRKKKKG